MKFKIFSINALNPNVGQEELNRFCSTHTLVAVEKQFVSTGLDSYWSFCIQYVDGGARGTQPRKERIDYREVLNESDFAIYSKLRSLRKTLAEKEGVPVYSVFTNEQLATMVRERTTTESALLHIDGVGKSRVEKYWAEFMPLLQEEFSRNEINETIAN